MVAAADRYRQRHQRRRPRWRRRAAPDRRPHRPDPRPVGLTQISAALRKARRRDIPAKAAAIQQALRTEHLGQADVVATAYAGTVRATIAVLQTLNTEIRTLDSEVEAHFGQHPDAEV
jgi:hypothetical protein